MIIDKSQIYLIQISSRTLTASRWWGFAISHFKPGILNHVYKVWQEGKYVKEIHSTGFV
jgi:hypothetical protein